MNRKVRTYTLFVVISVLIGTAVASKTLFAEDIKVDQSDVNCKTTSTPPCYLTIQDAINVATSGQSILVERGNYVPAATITLKDGITLMGRETAQTFLSGGGGSGPIVSVTGSLGANIQNFTFTSALSGIHVLNNTSTLIIRNNVFDLGTSGTAIAIQNSSNAQVINNVFYSNGTAINRDADIKIHNNIFRNNSTAAISALSVTATGISNNFFDIDTAPTGTRFIIGTDPGFVSPGSDFHLLATSPCITAGATSDGINTMGDTGGTDIGAYGGTNADTIPVKVANVLATKPTPTATSIDVSWSANTSYVIASYRFIAGYRLYYGTSPGIYNGKGAVEGNSPINVLSGETSTTLTSLSTATVPPASPTSLVSEPRDQSLILSWPAVPGATSYKIYYSLTSFGSPTTSTSSTAPDVPSNPQVSLTNSYTLTGLTNGLTYYIAVSAVEQTAYYIAVTTFDNMGLSTSVGVVGTSHESAYSQEQQVFVGPALEGAISPIITDFPEPIVPYPNLPNKGCFIATAAYGYYSAPEVQALREFRDRFLLTNRPGSAFVAWYYTHGPVAAAYLNAHPAWKPAVRAALLPAVGAALFLTRTPPITQFVAVMFAIFALAAVIAYRRRSGHGGPH